MIAACIAGILLTLVWAIRIGQQEEADQAAHHARLAEWRRVNAERRDASYAARYERIERERAAYLLIKAKNDEWRATRA